MPEIALFTDRHILSVLPVEQDVVGSSPGVGIPTYGSSHIPVSSNRRLLRGVRVVGSGSRLHSSRRMGLLATPAYNV